VDDVHISWLEPQEVRPDARAPPTSPRIFTQHMHIGWLAADPRQVPEGSGGVAHEHGLLAAAQRVAASNHPILLGWIQSIPVLGAGIHPAAKPSEFSALRGAASGGIVVVEAAQLAGEDQLRCVGSVLIHPTNVAGSAGAEA